ncbi:copper chaperone PCu(A)C [Ottowia sp.]|uniref:copper chaperone PCu(A)C n=1 Tax=Ottowia sp. TaxID=1898956 RepID=UPI0025F165E6|nr:copper chaperone PCu(A)C [Ottowia sp.]
MSLHSRLLVAGFLSTGSALAFAHVALPPGPAVAGSAYEAVFRVGHACKDARATTALTVRLPRGFALQEVPAHAGWTSTIDRSGDGTVRWTADRADQALPGEQKGAFVLRGQLSPQAGTLYFKVLQTCDVGSADWSQVPASGSAAAPGEQLAFPAARLQVVAPGTAPVATSEAWVRAAAPGQGVTGGFMKLAAGVPLRLVGVSTPAAGVAEVHEMKMEGDVMKMRPIAALELPAHQSVALKPGGFHVMLMNLKQPLAVGQQVPLTLSFEDAQGTKSTLQVQAPVMQAPAGGAHAPAHRH